MVNLQYVVPSDDPSNGLITVFAATLTHYTWEVPRVTRIGEIIDYSRRLRGDATPEFPVLAIHFDGKTAPHKWCRTLEEARQWLTKLAVA